MWLIPPSLLTPDILISTTSLLSHCLPPVVSHLQTYHYLSHYTISVYDVRQLLGQLMGASHPTLTPTAAVHTHSHVHAHMQRWGRRIGGIALCKIITMHLHSLWCGFVAINKAAEIMNIHTHFKQL